MKKKFKLLFISAFCMKLTLITIGQTPSGNWTLLPEISDEFTGSKLDTTKWSKRPGYSTSKVFAFNSENINISGGNLKLTAKKEDFHGMSYTSAFLESKFYDPGNGSYLEVRAKVIDFRANICCAIWEQVFHSSHNPNPEIDIQEFLLSPNPNRVQSTLHRWPSKPGIHTVDGSQSFNALTPLCYDFHTYGLERRDGKLQFYIDGFKYWENNVSSMPEYVTMPRHIIFSLEGHAGNPVDSYLPAVFQIDYVRIYKFADASEGTKNP